MKTQVAIIGAGPAGLLLAQMLKNAGIDSVILERRSKEYVLGRIRAGVLEPGSIETFTEQGVGERLHREAKWLGDMKIRWGGQLHRMAEINPDGRKAAIYGQALIVRDMIEQHEKDGQAILWESEVKRIEDLADAPKVVFSQDGREKTVESKFVAGVDGFRGVSRRHIPGSGEASMIREYPIGWLGIMAKAERTPDMEGYAHTHSGAAVFSSRGPAMVRHYIQVPPDTNPDEWADDALWDELDRRYADGQGTTLNRGPIVEKDVTRLRAFICNKMQHGRLFIGGDAAHLVPPTGAKGLNLAVGDVRVMFQAIIRNLTSGDTQVIEDYTDICLRRIYQMVHWADRLCRTLHIFPGQSAMETAMQEETLRKWFYTEAGQVEYSQNRLGAPYEM